ncbi:MAG: hypothetical protein HKUEN02_22440 [Anaerolineaceae bacterium]|nr:MAG: hypothetical protein HKUEN02_22440 [Anaerolineaceae bacterium]
MREANETGQRGEMEGTDETGQRDEMEGTDGGEKDGKTFLSTSRSLSINLWPWNPWM